ncbi:hypothetical protein GCM10010193_01060 [Kitasatospora atroaurantiaca]|uniref:Uncharacterized protein n=1 Tax=Kitasatospora atroaurantiaca TaxID=285545 RepID=A0A561EL94_9ACTN|nr:hypothetical protein FB465_1309 [Kitasatospora atroaurantiaca]
MISLLSSALLGRPTGPTLRPFIDAATLQPGVGLFRYPLITGYRPGLTKLVFADGKVDPT